MATDAVKKQKQIAEHTTSATVCVGMPRMSAAFLMRPSKESALVLSFSFMFFLSFTLSPEPLADGLSETPDKASYSVFVFFANYFAESWQKAFASAANCWILGQRYLSRTRSTTQQMPL